VKRCSREGRNLTDNLTPRRGRLPVALFENLDAGPARMPLRTLFSDAEWAAP
jgi:hypothetical protein